MSARLARNVGSSSAGGRPWSMSRARSARAEVMSDIMATSRSRRTAGSSPGGRATSSPSTRRRFGPSNSSLCQVGKASLSWATMRTKARPDGSARGTA
jgi:hypothetical protein